MKNIIKKYYRTIIVLAVVVMVGIFLVALLNKPGSNVYIVSTSGGVGIGSADTVNATALKNAVVGMQLGESDIIITDDKSTCTLAYKRKATNKDDFVTIGENSQVLLYENKRTGGYRFHVTYGNVICNMTNTSTYTSDVSTKLFNLDIDNVIIKVDYDKVSNMGHVYTFDGNPNIQLIQPSGAIGEQDKLLKNSVCAVSNLDNTTAYGCLNIGFGLNELTALDLKVMSGVANTWTEKISYSASEFEQAFQTAADNAKWTVTEPVVETSEHITEATVDTMVSGTVWETTQITLSEITTSSESVPETTTSTQASTTVSKAPDDLSRYAVTSFSRNFNDSSVVEKTEETTSVTTVVPKSEESVTTVPITTVKPKTTAQTTVTAGTTAKTTTAKTTTAKTTTAKTTVTTDVNQKKPGDTCLVVFSYVNDGQEFWSMQYVQYGEPALLPDVPFISNKVFVGWDKDTSCVISDMTVTAMFKDSSTITGGFRDTEFGIYEEYGDTSNATEHEVEMYVDNQLWCFAYVKHGCALSIDSEPVSDDPDYEFAGWSENVDNITSDITVFALFKKK